MQTLAGGVVGNERPGATLDEKLARRVAIIGGIGGAQAARRQRLQKAARQRGGARAAPVLFATRWDGRDHRQEHGFCCSPAARAADRLELGPPFPPAAERWALAVVLSIICTLPGFGGYQSGKHLPPDAAPRPAMKAVVDRGRGAVDGRAVLSAAPHLEDVDDAADDPPVVLAMCPWLVVRQQRFDRRPLPIVEPEFPRHDPKLPKFPA
jgi:hypothetical protein